MGVRSFGRRVKRGDGTVCAGRSPWLFRASFWGGADAALCRKWAFGAYGALAFMQEEAKKRKIQEK